MIKKIATVAIYVEDQQKAKTFWVEKVGFELVRETPMGPNAFWLEVAPQGAESALVIYPKSMMANHAELKSSIVFLTDNIQETYTNMKASGVEFEGDLMEMQWGTFATFKDEDGHSFLLKG